MSSIKLIVTGATGTAGAEVLRQALVHPKVEQVTVLSRRPLPPHVQPAGDNPKLKVIIHQDYASYPPLLLKELEGHDAVIWAQGKSAVGMKEDAYTVLTHDYPLAAAKAFATLKAPESSDKFAFIYLSGHGADQSEKASSVLFARIKGRAEVALAKLRDELPSLTTYSFRPAGIIPVEPTPEAGRLQKTVNFIAPALRPFFSTSLISTPELANGMIEAAVRGRSGEIAGWPGKGLLGDKNAFANEEIKKLAREGGFVKK